ncbi:hypothetical protein DPMN_102601 [Dreissena polymorpha]|uniref:Uncharacterized protein n=1 Tax=Dreissena polymorpha TaxID=45954 RepID=A0A9D4LJM5_DREPO|nr:hypothetical protein DPMN_102601 [Dreissena polymorpha]
MGSPVSPILTEHLNTVDTTGNTISGLFDIIGLQETYPYRSISAIRLPPSVISQIECGKNSMTDKEDQKRELDHIRGALKVCGYPQWAINKVVKDAETKLSEKQEGKGKRRKERDKTKNKSKGMDKTLTEEEKQMLKTAHKFSRETTEHSTRHNHVIDLERIAKERRVMNRDERGYQLSPIYRPLFTAGKNSGSKPAL